MKRFEVVSYFSKEDNFKMLMDAKLIEDVIKTIEKWILQNNFYRSSFEDSADVYNMGSVIYFKVNEINS